MNFNSIRLFIPTSFKPYNFCPHSGLCSSQQIMFCLQNLFLCSFIYFIFFVPLLSHIKRVSSFFAHFPTFFFTVQYSVLFFRASDNDFLVCCHHFKLFYSDWAHPSIIDTLHIPVIRLRYSLRKDIS